MLLRTFWILPASDNKHIFTAYITLLQKFEFNKETITPFVEYLTHPDMTRKI